MGQVTIYLDDETEQKVIARAEQSELSKSELIASMIQEKLADSWPSSVRALAGSWEDFPSVEVLRECAPHDLGRAFE